MRGVHLLIGLSLVLAGLSFSGAAYAQDACTGLVTPRLTVGATARVAYNGDGIGSTLRDNPGKEQSGSQLIGTIPEGTIITILEGPICLDGMVWWKASLVDGSEAWIAEGDTQQYYLVNYVLGTEVISPDADNPTTLHRWFVTYSGQVNRLPPFTLPAYSPRPASELWQETDLVLAQSVLNDRLSRCPSVLDDTPWQGIRTAGDVLVPEAPMTLVPDPDGGKAFVVRHFVLRIPECEGGPGAYYGVSTTHLVTEREIRDLFPFGQHGGTRSKQACLSPDVINPDWATDLSEVIWSPDADTVAFTARYLDTDSSGRPCAFYFIFLVDVFNGGITPIAEGRRVVWAAGGTQLYYFTFAVDNGYNILEEQLQLLSGGQTQRVNIPLTGDSGAQFVPAAFNSTGVILPATANSGRLLLCDTRSGCPNTLMFEIARKVFSNQPMELPDNLLPRQLAAVHFVAGDTRLLWITTDGRVYIQSVYGPDSGIWLALSLPVPDARVHNVVLLPTGIAVVLLLDSGDVLLVNTVSRSMTELQLD